MEEAQNPTILYVLLTLGGALLAIIGNYVVKRLETNKEITIANIGNDISGHSELKKKLHDALESIKELKEELSGKQSEIDIIVKRFDAVKVAYRIIFKQYALMYKNDPEQLTLLKELNDIINED